MCRYMNNTQIDFCRKHMSFVGTGGNNNTVFGFVCLELIIRDLEKKHLEIKWTLLWQ